MDQLIEKLERAERGAAQPLGFGGAAKRESVAPMLLLAAVDAGDAAQAKAVAASGVDAALIKAGGAKQNVAIEKSAKALAETTFGVWTEEGLDAAPDGADFEVFSSSATLAGAIAGEGRTIVMQAEPEMDDALLRTLGMLPVDAFLVTLGAPLTVAELMRFGRVRGATSRRVFARLPAAPSKAEAEQLRDAGASALVVDAKGQSADALRETLSMLRELPRKSPRRRDRSGATIPQPGRTEAAASPAPPPDDDDDDDWDDD